MQKEQTAFEGTLEFADGQRASTRLVLSPERVTVVTEAGDVPNWDSYDRRHVVRLRVTMHQSGKWMPVLLLASGTNVSLPVFLDKDDAKRLALAF